MLCLLALVSLSSGASAQPEADPGPAEGKPGKPAVIPASAKQAPAKQATENPPGGDPFVRLKPVVSKEKLPVLVSVRVRDNREAEDRSRKRTITVSVATSPKGAAVYYGGKLLGTTPLSLSAPRGSTPFDVVIRRPGYMTLHTRLMRKVTRGYAFKLTPAKLH